MYRIPCRNCNGMGEIQHFQHVDNGICFSCHGSKFEEVGKEEYDFFNQKQEESKSKLNNQMDECYYHFFINGGKAYITYKSQLNFENVNSRFEIKGTKEKGFFINIDGNCIPVKAKFKRKPRTKRLYISRWVIA